MDFSKSGNEKSSERDDDSMENLIRMQEIFLSRNQKPSVKVTRIDKKNGGEKGKKWRSHFAKRHETTQNKSTQLSQEAVEPGDTGAEQSLEAEASHASAPACAAIVSEIVERNADCLPTPLPLGISASMPASSGGFPSVAHRSTQPSMSRLSFRARTQAKESASPNLQGGSELTVNLSALPGKQKISNPSEPSSLEEEIDRENRTKLEEMSIKAIEEAQNELLKSLSPELVAKLKERGLQKQRKGKPRTETSAPQPVTEGQQPSSKLVAPQEQPADTVTLHGNMCICCSGNQNAAEEAEVVKFHGLDLTTEELIKMSRSTVLPQRLAAVKKMRLLLTENPNEPCKGLLTALCTCLGDRNCPVVLEALAAIAAYMHDAVLEEVAGLYKLLPTGHIWMHQIGDSEEEEKDSDDNRGKEGMSDEEDDMEDDEDRETPEEVCARNRLLGMVKMNVGPRISALLLQERLNSDGLCTALKILCQLCRTSTREGSRLLLADGGRLLGVIKRLLQPSSFVLEGLLLNTEDAATAAQTFQSVLQFLQCACQSSKAVTESVVTSGIVRSLKGFLVLQTQEEAVDAQGTPSDSPFTKIQVEVLHLWKICIAYGLDTEACVDLQPALLDMILKKGQCPLTAILYQIIYSLKFHLATLAKSIESNQVSSGLTAMEKCLQTLLNEAVQNGFQKFGKLESMELLFDACQGPSLLAWLQLIAVASTDVPKDIYTSVLSLASTEGGKLVEKLQHALSAKDHNTWEALATCQVFKVFSEVHCSAELFQVGLTDSDGKSLVFNFVGVVFDALKVMASTVLEAPSVFEEPGGWHRVWLHTGVALSVFLNQDSTREGLSLTQQKEIQSIAMKLIPAFAPGEEYLASQLFEAVIFFKYPWLDTCDGIRLSTLCKMHTNSLCQETNANHSRAVFKPAPQALTSLHTFRHQKGTLLPLPNHWIFLTFASQGGSYAAALMVSAALEFIRALEVVGENLYLPCVPIPKRVYFLLNICFYGVEVLTEDAVACSMKELLESYVVQCGESLEQGLMEAIHEENKTTSDNSYNSLMSFVTDLTEGFVNESFGLPLYAECLRLFLRVRFPPKLRAYIWKELTRLEMASLLNAEHIPEDFAHYFNPPDSESSLLDCYVQALKSEKFSEQAGFTKSVAVHHLASFLFAQENAVYDCGCQQASWDDNTICLSDWSKQKRIIESIFENGKLVQNTLCEILCYPIPKDDQELFNSFGAQHLKSSEELKTICFSEKRQKLLRAYSDASTLVHQNLVKIIERNSIENFLQC